MLKHSTSVQKREKEQKKYFNTLRPIQLRKTSTKDKILFLNPENVPFVNQRWRKLSSNNKRSVVDELFFIKMQSGQTSSETVRAIRLPTLQARRYTDRRTPSPAYFSPIKQLRVFSNQKSPRIRDQSLPLEKYEKIIELDKSVRILHDYSTLLGQVDELHQDNLRAIITSNKTERQIHLAKIQKAKDMKVQSVIQKQYSSKIEKLNEQDPFIIKELRLKLINKESAIDQIIKRNEEYNLRRKLLILNLQEKKYHAFWKQNRLPMKKNQVLAFDQ